jgi:hypothetical protein
LAAAGRSSAFRVLSSGSAAGRREELNRSKPMVLQDQSPVAAPATHGHSTYQSRLCRTFLIPTQGTPPPTTRCTNRRRLSYNGGEQESTGAERRGCGLASYGLGTTSPVGVGSHTDPGGVRGSDCGRAGREPPSRTICDRCRIHKCHYLPRTMIRTSAPPDADPPYD